MAEEKRIDAEDGAAYTFEELKSYYKGKYKKAEIAAYWDECKPVKKKGKAKKEPEPAAKGKAKAKAKTKAKAKAKAAPEPKAKAKAKAKAEAPKPLLGKPAGPGQYRSAKPVNVTALTRMCKDDLGLLPQPLKPRFRTALVGIYVRAQPYGGSDKSSNGHRYDSIPFANGVISSGMSCQLIQYVHDEHSTFFEVCKNFDALIVRCKALDRVC